MSSSLASDSRTIWLIVLLLCPRYCNSQQNRSCDRARSRTAGRVLQQYLLPQIRRLQFELPPQCPLRPDRNKYAEHEAAKRHVRHGQWECGLCGKAFRGEHFLDGHLEARHSGELQQACTLEGRVCLAELCGALHCNVLGVVEDAALDSPNHDSHYERVAPCRITTAAARRRDCEEIGDTCFLPDGSREARLLHDLFVGHFCAAHTCDSMEKRRLLQLLEKSRGAPRWGFRIGAGFALLLLAGFYAVFWAYYRYNRGYRTREDVQRLHRRRHWLRELLGKRKPL